MSTNNPSLNPDRLSYASKVIEKYGSHMSPEVREAILSQKVILGMPPYEASLAAGEYTFEVKPDPKWPPNYDPIQIIAAQSMHPDDSLIWCTFSNKTQFPESKSVRFKVAFKSGRAVSIEKLD